MFEPINLGLALIAGFLSTLQPCVLPLIPIVLGGAVYRNKFAPLYIGSGMVLFYTLLGAVTGFIEPFFGVEPAEFKTIGAWMMIASGFILLAPHIFSGVGALYSGVLAKLARSSQSLSFESPAACLLLGAMLSLIWAPCAGPMLASALTLLTAGVMGETQTHSMQSTIHGSVLLGIYGVGAAAPLVILAYVTRVGFARWRNRLLTAQGLMTKVLGISFLVFGLLVLSGLMKSVEIFILSMLPDSWLGFVNSI
jgi:cytochrome c biogenesis protein CcdA